MALLNKFRSRLWRGILLAAALGTSGLPPARGAPANPSAEYQLKAVFLFNFAQFVEWPDRAMSGPSAPLCIGVLGPDPFGSYLDDLVRGEKVGAHPLVVRRCQRVEDAEGCQILFLAGSDPGTLAAALGRLRGRPILTVGEGDGFLRLGGVIRFAEEGGRIRLRVNPQAASERGLLLSSKLLRAASVVRAGRD